MAFHFQVYLLRLLSGVNVIKLWTPHSTEQKTQQCLSLAGWPDWATFHHLGYFLKAQVNFCRGNKWPKNWQHFGQLFSEAIYSHFLLNKRFQNKEFRFQNWFNLDEYIWHFFRGPVNPRPPTTVILQATSDIKRKVNARALSLALARPRQRTRMRSALAYILQLPFYVHSVLTKLI